MSNTFQGAIIKEITQFANPAYIYVINHPNNERQRYYTYTLSDAFRFYIKDVDHALLHYKLAERRREAYYRFRRWFPLRVDVCKVNSTENKGTVIGYDIIKSTLSINTLDTDAFSLYDYRLFIKHIRRECDAFMKTKDFKLFLDFVKIFIPLDAWINLYYPLENTITTKDALFFTDNHNYIDVCIRLHNMSFIADVA